MGRGAPVARERNLAPATCWHLYQVPTSLPLHPTDAATELNNSMSTCYAAHSIIRCWCAQPNATPHWDDCPRGMPHATGVCTDNASTSRSFASRTCWAIFWHVRVKNGMGMGFVRRGALCFVPYFTVNSLPSAMLLCNGSIQSLVLSRCEYNSLTRDTCSYIARF